VVSGVSPRKMARDGQWQELVDDFAALMLADIASWRGLAGPAEVSAAYGGGAQVSGVRAVALGLADGFLTATEEEGEMPRANPAPVVTVRAEAQTEEPQGPTVEEMTATIEALKAELAELKAKLAEMEPAEEMPAEAAALASAHGGTAPALSALAARVAELERQTAVERKGAIIGVAVAEGRIAPHERAVAEALYDSHPDLYRSQFGGRAAGSAVPLGRVTHGAAVAVEESPSARAHAKVLAYCEAHGLDPRTQYHIAAVKAGASKGV
jgi:hypothetical protein